MATTTLFNQSAEKIGEIELAQDVFGIEPVQHLLHLVVRKQLAARRAGTHAVKGRAEVSGGGRKPFKQKGTGRARQGTTRAPHMRGGGVAFGPVPRSHDFKVNKKEMALALRSALSVRVANDELFVIDNIQFDAPKTKLVKSFLSQFNLTDALIVTADAEGNLQLAVRNLKEVTLLPPIGVNVYDVLRRDRLVLTRGAVEALTTRLGGAK